MTEQELHELLHTTSDFLERQRLLKQLWHLQRQRDTEATQSDSAQGRQLSQSIQRVALQGAEALVG